MGRSWNILGWVVIVIVLPVMLYATSVEPEDAAPRDTHASCHTCRFCRGPQLPLVIDGNNLHVVSSGRATPAADPSPVEPDF